MFKRRTSSGKQLAVKAEPGSSSPTRRKGDSPQNEDSDNSERGLWFQTGRMRVASLVSKSGFADRVSGKEETHKDISHLEGYLYKENRKGKNQKRFFAVNNSYLNYYRNRAAYKQNKVKGSVNLIHATTICVLVRNGKPTRRFAIQTEGEEDHEEYCLFLKAKTKQAARMWVESLNARRTFWLGPNAPPEHRLPAYGPNHSSRVRVSDTEDEEGWKDRIASDDEEDTDEGFQSARSREYSLDELEALKRDRPVLNNDPSAHAYSSSSNEEDQDSEDEDAALPGSRKSRSSSTFRQMCEALPETSRFLSVPHHPWSTRFWCRPDCRELVVRGPNYLTTKQKIPVETEPLFECIAVDMFAMPERIDHICAHPRNRVYQAKQRGEKLPFMFVLQFQVPGPPHYTMVVYLAAKHPEIVALLDPAVKDNPPQLSNAFPPGMRQLLLSFFRTGSDEFCSTHYKLIPRIVEGPWIVRAGVPSKPALIGTKLKNAYFHCDEYFELDINIGANAIATTITQLAASYAKLITVDLAFVVEGKLVETLPEFIIGIVRCVHIDFRHAMPLNENQIVPS